MVENTSTMNSKINTNPTESFASFRHRMPMNPMELANDSTVPSSQWWEQWWSIWVQNSSGLKQVQWQYMLKTSYPILDCQIGWHLIRHYTERSHQSNTSNLSDDNAMCISQKKSGLQGASSLQDRLKEYSSDTPKAIKYIVYGYLQNQTKFENQEMLDLHWFPKRVSVLIQNCPLINGPSTTNCPPILSPPTTNYPQKFLPFQQTKLEIWNFND